MIKFFRHIRKQLLTENKFNKYLLYAIGEIVLVVIGILIALQINNWNEQQKLNKEEASFLQRMRQDLVKDTLYFTAQINEGETTIQNTRKFIQEIYKIQNTQEEFSAVLDLFVARTEELVVNNTAYQELNNAGKLNIIKNQEVREAIIGHYRHYDYITLQLHDFNVFTRELLVPSPLNSSLWKYYTIYGSEETFNESDMFHKSDWEFINNPRSTEFRQLENLANQFMNKHGSANWNIQGLKDRTTLLIKKIEEEIEMINS
jgi:hypothetical protein